MAAKLQKKMEYPIEIKGKTIKQVHKLNLSGKNLKFIPDNVYQYTNLEKLDLSKNRIEIIPKEILKLRKLRTLDLAFNQIKNLQSAVFQLPKLRILNLHGNQIKKLPKQIATSQIETLILSKNNIVNVDDNLMAKFKRIDLTDNPITQNVAEVKIDEKAEVLHDAPLANLNINFMEKEIEEKKMEMKKHKIFISYAHTDKVYCDRLMIHLKVLKNYVGGIDVWSDQRIKTGQRWKEEIERALREADIAILLVSTDFLASDFIQNNELPPILHKAASANTKIMSILIKPSMFLDSDLAEFQAVNDTQKTLSDMSETEQEKTYLKLMSEIKDLVKS
mgnify:FL=1